MRTLHVVTSLSTGGAERALYNVLAGGLAKRFDSAVVSLRDEGAVGQFIASLDVPVYALNMSFCSAGLSVIAKLRHIVQSFRPDLVQGWMYHGNLAAYAAAQLGGSPAVVWNIRQCLYGFEMEKLLTRQVIRGNRYLSGNVRAVIYNCKLARIQHEAFGFASAQGQVIPNGFDPVRHYPSADARTAVRFELDVPDDALIVGHVARFHPVKDHVTFLRAAVMVARLVPRSRFLLVGRDVTLENRILADVVPPALKERFIFTGERADVHRLMQAMDVFCLSSRSEAFPNVLGEAMACGVPCVATDVGDCREIIGNTGVLVSPLDSSALASGLLALLGKSAAELQSLGRAARERIQARYSLSSAVEGYSSLYESLGIKGRR